MTNREQSCRKITLLILGCVLLQGISAVPKIGRGPVFLHEPPPKLHFSNSTGVILPCSAHGSPPPIVSWLTANGKEVEDIPGIRKLHSNGSLHLLPFAPSAYTASVHAITYACKASSAEGIILSRPVKVRAVVRQYYEVQVYDEFVISGNTAVLKCHVPSFVRDYVTVTSWIRGSGENIVTDVMSGGRYSVFETGELHIRHVTKTDEFQSYQCVTKHILSGETSISTVAGRLMVNDPRSSVPPRITDSKSILRAVVGSTIELPCAAQGYPIPQYKWYKIKGEKKQDVQIKEIIRSSRTKQVGGSLVLTQVAATDAGKYVCVVTSSVGEERSHTVLEVWASLSAHISPQVQTVDVGGDASFTCSTEGFPLETIAWLKDGRPMKFNRRVRLDSMRRIVVESVNRGDRGMYQCVISNDKDGAQGSAQLKLGDAAPQWINTTGPKVVSPGAKVTLQCIIQGSPPPILSWFLSGENITSKRGKLRVENEIKRDIVVSRVFISSVSVEDGGIWSCTGKNRAGKISHKERLNVRGPPSIRPMAPVSVVAGQPASFDCVVVGYPIDTIYWEKNGVVLPVSPKQTVEANGTLQISKISREADGGEYSCVANAGDTSVRAKLNVDVSVPPEINRRLFSWGEGHPVGASARIMCVVERGDLPLRFRWLHNSRPLEPRNSVSIRHLDDQTSILLFNSVTQSDAGNYTCVASNEVSNDSHSSVLLVKVAPSWSKEPKDVSVVAGTNVKLPCLAAGSPQPNVTWRRAQGGVPRQYIDVTALGENVRILRENKSLLISNIRRSQGGEFLCIASNGVGSDLSKSVRVSVKVPPQFEIREENVTIIARKRATLSCFAHGNLPIKIIWSKGYPPKKIDTGELRDKNKYDIRDTVISELQKGLKKDKTKSPKLSSRLPLKEPVEGFKSTIKVSTSSREDSAAFHCLASNVYGNDTKMINLIVQEVPERPGPPKVSNVGSRSINLTWEPPSHDGNSPILTYRVEIINSTDTWIHIRRIRRAEVSSNTITIGGLRPAHSYLVRVIAMNAVGSSSSSKEMRIITVHEPPTVAPSNLHVLPLSSTSLKASWKMLGISTSELVSYGYYVGYKLANSSEPFRYVTIESSSFSVLRPEAILSGLRKYSHYVVIVQAFNEAGAGPRSSPAIARTNEDVPSEPPRDIQCSALSSRSLLLKWSPPDPSSVNGVLQGYTLSYSPLPYKHYYSLNELKTKTVMTVSTTLVNLSPYTNYSVFASAHTGLGDGVRSNSIYCLTKEDVPGEVEHLKALSMDRGSILLSWLPPSQPNGIIIKYSITMRTHQTISPWQSDEGILFPASHSVVDSSLLEALQSPPTNMIQMAPRVRESGDPAERSWVIQGTETHHMIGALSERTSYSFNVRAATRIGEGPRRTPVIQRPRHDAPAAIASFSREIIGIWGEELRLPCWVVGRPTPSRIWLFNGKQINRYSDDIQEYPDGSLLLTDITSSLAGNYSCRASNLHGSERIIYAVSVKASRDRGEPPSAPQVYIAEATASTLDLKYHLEKEEDRIGVEGFYIHLKKEFEDWKRFEVLGTKKSYVLKNLSCGTRYQVYVTAFNHVGPSQASDVIATRTLGREPIIPSSSEFILENSSSVSLKLSSWSDGGCQIISFVIEYQKDGANNWKLVTNYARWTNRSNYVIPGLRSRTAYNLRVTAYNAAGSSIATYSFSTKYSSGTYPTEQMQKGSQWLFDGPVFVAVITAVILVGVAISVGIFFTRKRVPVEDPQECKDITHVTPPVGVNGTTLIRRRSMNIMDAYMPPVITPQPEMDHMTCYSTFKGEALPPPPPPLPSPVECDDDNSIYSLRLKSRDSYALDSKHNYDSSESGDQYEC